jgi:hypothetical protein
MKKKLIEKYFPSTIRRKKLLKQLGMNNKLTPSETLSAVMSISYNTLKSCIPMPEVDKSAIIFSLKTTANDELNAEFENSYRELIKKKESGTLKSGKVYKITELQKDKIKI